MFEKAREILLAKNAEDRAKDEKHCSELDGLSRALDCPALNELRVDDAEYSSYPYLPYTPYGLLKKVVDKGVFTEAKSRVDAYLAHLREDMARRRVTFKDVCDKVYDLLAKDDDSHVLREALSRLLLHDNNDTIRVKINSKTARIGVMRTRKFTVNHDSELKRALVATKKKRPDLHMLLPRLLELKRNMYISMHGEPPRSNSPIVPKHNEETDEEELE